VGETRFASYDWMVRLLLGFGGAIRVLEPAELAVQVRDRARAALAAYGAAQLQQG
jgi:proteasome accessory factor C